MLYKRGRVLETVDLNLIERKQLFRLLLVSVLKFDFINSCSLPKILGFLNYAEHFFFFFF